MAVTSVIGLLASFTLLRDTLEVARDPSFNPSCNINPILSCQSVMSSSQAEILGIPNPAFGIAAFTALFVFAVLVLARTSFASWIWKVGIAIATAGLLFTLYLYLTSITVLGTICPWCFVTWLVTVAIFWSLITYTLAAKIIVLPKKLLFLSRVWVRYASLILASWYVALVFILLLRFREALFG